MRMTLFFIIFWILSLAKPSSLYAMKEEAPKDDASLIKKSKSRKKEPIKRVSLSLKKPEILWDKPYDDAEKDTFLTRQKRNRLMEELKDRDIKVFLKKYHHDGPKLENPQQIYIGKTIVPTPIKEGQWKVPQTMREAIGLLSPRGVECVFDEENFFDVRFTKKNP